MPIIIYLYSHNKNHSPTVSWKDACRTVALRLPGFTRCVLYVLASFQVAGTKASNICIICKFMMQKQLNDYDKRAIRFSDQLFRVVRTSI